MINRLSFGPQLQTKGFTQENFVDRDGEKATPADLEHINSHYFGSDGIYKASKIGTDSDVILLQAIGDEANTSKVFFNRDEIGTIKPEQIAEEFPISPTYVAGFLRDKAFDLVKEALK